MGTGSTLRMVETYAAAIDADAVALSLHGQPLVASDVRSRDVEAWQFVCGEGPTIEAFASNTAVGTCDTTGPSEWMWLDDALGTWPFRGVFAFPVAIGAVAVGALTVYRGEPGDMTASLRAATAACVGDSIRWLTSTVLDDTGFELDEFDTVHRAAGVVMAQAGVSPSDALAAIHAHCYSTRRHIGSVLDDILAMRLVLA